MALGGHRRQHGFGLSQTFSLAHTPGSKHLTFLAETFQVGAQGAQALLANGLFAAHAVARLDFATQIPTPIGQAAAQLHLALAQGRRLRIVGGDGLLCAGDDPLPVGNGPAGINQLVQGQMPVVPVPDQQQLAQLGRDGFVLPRPLGLALQLAEPRADLGDDVADAGQVLLRLLQLFQCLAPLLPVEGDAGCFFEEFAAIFGPQGQSLVDHALTNDDMGAASQAGTVKQLVDITQTHLLPVEIVLVLA